MNELPEGLTIKGKAIYINGPFADGRCLIIPEPQEPPLLHLGRNGEWQAGDEAKEDYHASRAAAIEFACSVADLPEGWSIEAPNETHEGEYLIIGPGKCVGFQPSARAAYLAIQAAARRENAAGGDGALSAKSIAPESQDAPPAVSVEEARMTQPAELPNEPGHWTYNGDLWRLCFGPGNELVSWYRWPKNMNTMPMSGCIRPSELPRGGWHKAEPASELRAEVERLTRERDAMANALRNARQWLRSEYALNDPTQLIGEIEAALGK